MIYAPQNMRQNNPLPFIGDFPDTFIPPPRPQRNTVSSFNHWVESLIPTKFKVDYFFQKIIVPILLQLATMNFETSVIENANWNPKKFKPIYSPKTLEYRLQQLSLSISTLNLSFQGKASFPVR